MNGYGQRKIWLTWYPPMDGKWALNPLTLGIKWIVGVRDEHHGVWLKQKGGKNETFPL